MPDSCSLPFRPRAIDGQYNLFRTPVGLLCPLPWPHLRGHPIPSILHSARPSPQSLPKPKHLPLPFLIFTPRSLTSPSLTMTRLRVYPAFLPRHTLIKFTKNRSSRGHLRMCSPMVAAGFRQARSHPTSQKGRHFLWRVLALEESSSRRCPSLDLLPVAIPHGTTTSHRPQWSHLHRRPWPHLRRQP